MSNPKLPPNAPHRFADGSLCLYWWKDWSWSADRLLAQTILPWAALWLYYYELWQLVGEWLGPEAPHGRGARPTRFVRKRRPRSL